jgi:hypothetical protein
MTEFLLSFAILLMVVAAMAIGVMRGRAPISGSCGGLNNAAAGGSCEFCGGEVAKCEAVTRDPGKPENGNFFDAS